MKTVNSENAPVYIAKPAFDQSVIDNAKTMLLDSLRKHGDALTNPDMVKDYLMLELAADQAECFCCLFLDNRHRVIEFKRMFNGTIDGASVHPREIARHALKVNAAAIIIAHNHPSGIPEPSRADIAVTKRIIDALALLDIRTLDHIIIGHGENVSFAERGLI